MKLPCQKLNILLIMFFTFCNNLKAIDNTPDGWHNALKPAGNPGPEITLANNGKTDYKIIIPAQATPQDKEAAHQLNRWLKLITGATFLILTDAEQVNDDSKIISIGNTNQLKQSNVAALSQDLKDEGYGIAVKNDQLFLWGGKKRGAINSALALLEEDLGCRWYTKENSRIPHQPTLTCAPVPRTYVPQLRLRDPFYYVSFNSYWSLMNRTNAPSAKIPENWGGHIDYDGLFVHTFNTLVPPDKYFKDYPEYYMLDKKGNRDPYQLCTTNSDVIKIVIESVKQTLKENPNTEIVSVSKNDGGRTCLCKNCKALDDAEGTNMASLLYLVNKVAEAIEQEYPQVTISTLAYLETIGIPKTMRPRKNVAIRVCNDMCSWPHPFTPAGEYEDFSKVLTSWSKVCKRMYIWDYNVNFSHYLAPMPNMDVIVKNIRFFIENNAEGIMTQGAYQSPGSERDLMRSWVIAKLMWNPSLDVWELMRDFTWGYYGNVAPVIDEYNQLLEQQAVQYKEQLYAPDGGIRYKMDHPFLSKDFIDKADELFDRAGALAENDEILCRVEEARLPVMYVKLCRGPEFVGKEYPALVDRFEIIAHRVGITHLREGSPDLEEKLNQWRKTK